MVQQNFHTLTVHFNWALILPTQLTVVRIVTKNMQVSINLIDSNGIGQGKLGKSHGF